jgi:hypothetical protein
VCYPCIRGLDEGKSLSNPDQFNPADQQNDRSAILLSTPKWVLYRCLERGIQRKNVIDLSYLGLTTTADLDQVARVMKMFKPKPPFHGVRSIDLSNNNLTCMFLHVRQVPAADAIV